MNKIGHIIEMRGTDLFEHFIENEDYREYDFLLVSSDIKTLDRYDNVSSLQAIIPLYEHMSYFNDNKKKKYIKEYTRYLNRSNCQEVLAVIVITALHKGRNIILLCSDEEAEYEYISIMRQVIEDNYKGIKTYKYKKYIKARDNGKLQGMDSDKLSKLVDETRKLATKMAKKNAKAKELRYKKKKEEILGRLETMDKSAMKDFCKKKKYKEYKDLSGKELRKFILKKLMKEVEKEERRK